jgi:hypothetical protein
MFIMSRYDITDTRIQWLCPRCHTLESNEIKIHQPMQTNNNRRSSDDESTAEDIASDEDDDEDIEEEVSSDNEDDEDNDYMNDDMKLRQKTTIKELMLNQWMKNQVTFLMISNINVMKQ